MESREVVQTWQWVDTAAGHLVDASLRRRWLPRVVFFSALWGIRAVRLGECDDGPEGLLSTPFCWVVVQERRQGSVAGAQSLPGVEAQTADFAAPCLIGAGRGGESLPVADLP